MAFPTLVDVMLSVVVLVVGVPIIYLLSKVLKLRPKPITIADPRKEATLVFLVIIAVFLATSTLELFKHAVINPAFRLDKHSPFSFDVVDLLWVVFTRAILLLPLIVAMKRTGQTLGSIGISGKDSGRMLALGSTLSAIYVTITGFLAPSLGGGFIGFSLSLLYGLIGYAILGLCDEIVWRGYTQTRLIACSGTPNGLAVTSLLRALWHLPARYYMYSGVALEALASSLLFFPASLLLGYIMLRSQDIIPSSIFHLFWNWNALLWQIPS